MSKTPLFGILYLKREALKFRKAIDMRKSLRLNYCCTNCKEWNTYTFNLERINKMSEVTKSW